MIAVHRPMHFRTGYGNAAIGLSAHLMTLLAVRLLHIDISLGRHVVTFRFSQPRTPGVTGDAPTQEAFR